jgi:hypothetical protein
LVLAVLMSAATLAGPKVMRRQIGRVRTVQSHVMAGRLSSRHRRALPRRMKPARGGEWWFLPAAFVGA